MNIIKRNGSQASYNSDKIRIAIAKANATVPEEERLSEQAIFEIEEHVRRVGQKMARALGVEEIQDMVESRIMHHGA